ncbi:helix-turn-helix domain-containing protein [Natronococcus sp.]|uniref:helix-turn-helix domain-containing protein n=1 Tax=Natronococcus sp. TaxID=35747 RepID=UPI003A4DE648
MTSIVNLEISSEGTGLAELFESVPSLACEAEAGVVSDGYDLWLSGASKDEIESGLADASTIEDRTLVNGSEEQWLYNVTFAPDAIDLFEVVLEEGGTILDASASGRSWNLNIRVQERSDASSIHTRLEELDLEPTVIRLYDTSDETGSQSGLTQNQYETLVAAINYGYFEIPRDVSMQELSEELGVSHQALSERLRRAYRSLVTSELDVSPEETEPALSSTLSD